MTLTGLAFMLLFFALLGLALFKDPIYGLVAYVADFYIHPPSRWWGATLPDLRWSLLAAVVTLLAIWIRMPPEVKRQAWYSTAPAKILMLFVAWFWIGWFWALDREQHVPAAIMLTKYIAIYYAIYRIINTQERITFFLLLHLAGCFYLGFLGWTSNNDGRLDGVGGPGINDASTLGMQLGTGVIAGTILLLHLKGWQRWFCFVALAFAMNTIILTGSRGAFVGIVAAGLILNYLRPKAYQRAFYACAVVGVLLFGYLANDSFWERMGTMSAAVDDSQQMDGSAESRVEMLRAQLEMWKRYPFGSGHRGSEYLSAQYLEQKYLTAGGARSSHNGFMTIAVEQGIPGIILFIAVLWWTATKLRRMKLEFLDPERASLAVQSAAIGGALTVILAAGMFADFTKCEVQFWMMALLASLTQFLEKQPSGVRSSYRAVEPTRATKA